jgi:hypothetical protein
MSISFRRSTAVLATGCAAKRFVVSPSTVAPGVVQVHNSGNQPIILLSKKHAGVDKLVKDLKSQGLKVFSDFAMRGALMPHRSVFLRLNRGTLFTVDGARMHYPANSVHVVTIAGRPVNAKVPYSRAITVTGHNILKVPANVSHKTWFHLVNNSHRTQDIVLFRTSSKTTLSEIKAAAANPTAANLAKLDLSDIVDLAMLAPHQTLWTRMTGGKGNGLVFALAITDKVVNAFRKGGLGAIHFH